MGLPANDRSIAAFTMLGHGLVHWFEMSIPIFLVVWIDEFAVSVALAGLVAALGYAPFGLGALPGGLLADRFGARRVILLCYAGMTISFLALALAPTIRVVALALILWGIAASVYHPAGMALISTGARRRGTVFAYHGIAGNTGIALGPFAAATLLAVFEWPIVAALLAAPGLLAVAYGLRASFDPTAAVDDSEAGASTALSARTLLANSRYLFAGGFLVVFALVAFEGLYYRGVLTFLPEILQDLEATSDLAPGTGLAGIEPGDYVFVGLLVVGIAGQYAGGKLTERVAVERGLLVVFAVLAVLAVAFVPATELGAVGLLAVCGLLGFFLFAIQPFYQVAVAQYSPPDTRGLSYGYTYLAEFGFGAASIAIGGAVLGAYGLGAFFAVLAGFAVVAGGLAIVLLVGSDRLSFLEPRGAEAAD
ncbi:MFS transporter [Halobacteriales archaeon QH_10_67_13]|nr:MAG: MFS transporter [Halobacteriales archaeon QH_10_67_13]